MATRVQPLRRIIPAWTFADRLRKVRLLVGMTQREFAAAIGQKASRYAQWEAGNNGPRNLPDVARAIESVTGVSAAWLVGLEPDPTGTEPPVGFEPTTYRLQGRRPQHHPFRLAAA